MRAGLSPQPQPLDVPHQPLGLCQYHKDLFAFFSICTYMFMYFCLFLFTSISPDSPVIHERASWDIPKTYSGGIHQFLLLFPKLDWECLEFVISCRWFWEFSLDVPAKTTLRFLLFFNLMKHIASNSLIYCMLLFVIILLYYCKSANLIETLSCHFICRFCSVTVCTGQACGPVQHSIYHLGVCFSVMF